MIPTALISIKNNKFTLQNKAKKIDNRIDEKLDNSNLILSSSNKAIFLNGESYLTTFTDATPFDVSKDFTIESYINLEVSSASPLTSQGIFTFYPGKSEPQSYNLSLIKKIM